MGTKTIEGTRSDKVLQFSIFLPNQVGRLLDVVRMIAARNIHVLGLTILDTSDSAIARLIVDDPDGTRNIFEENEIAFTETPLLAVELPSSAVDLESVLRCLLQAECNIHYAYSFLTRPKNNAVLALHVEDEEVASGVLKQNGFRILTQKDISR